MKKLFAIVLVLATITTYSQSEKKIKIKTTSLTFTVNSEDKLETINWGDAKEFFEDNDKDEEISLGIKIKKNGEALVIPSKHDFLITGKVKNIDELIKIISNYKVKKTSKIKNSELIYTVNSVEKLKEIDWNNVKKSFEGKDKNEEITLGFKIKGEQEGKSKKSIKQNFILTGKVKQLDKLIRIMSNYIENQ